MGGCFRPLLHGHDTRFTRTTAYDNTALVIRVRTHDIGIVCGPGQPSDQE
ncbi:hypothetical protein [Streptomyces sp. NPDC002676]